ncbi:MAG: DUF4838 domain-containing protein, partial [Planctomycetes bacterium]|nr:DUF4838 domain-containing protein [Planctomycetota bacterium]
YFISRIMSGLDDRGPQSELTRRVTFASFWRMNYTIPSNESYYRLMKPLEHLNEPELFPLINGKRFVPTKPKEQGWQPCVSNPRVAEIMADSIKEHFRQNPDKFALNLAVNDGYGDCTCDKCRAMDAPDADPINRIGLCDRYVKFDNQVAELVAKEFPGKILAFIAYGSMRLPPTTVKLHPMLTPVLCVGGNTFQMWDDWQKMGATHMGAYFYHDDVWFIIPKMDIHQSAKRIRYMVSSGRARHFYQEFYGIYPLDGMVGYVEQELTWDPRLKEDDLLAEYYGKFYGKAAAQMKAFYDALEGGYHAWLEAVGEPHPFGRDAGSMSDSKSLKQFAVLPVEVAANAQRSLEAALAASQGDTLVQERIKLVKSLFDFAALGSRLYWAGERLRGAAVNDPASAEKALADAREAVHSGLALADYKFQVMEQPGIKAYADHGDRDTFYNDLQKGDVHSEVVSEMVASFDRVSAWLSKSIGPAKSEAWWQERRRADDPPLLRRLMDVAAFDASGRKLENLVKDPSFEERGVKQVASTEANKDGHLTHGGVNVWSSAGTPMSCALTREDAHTGKHSFVFWQTQRAGVSESVTVKEGDRLRMSVWVKHNDKKGTYIVQTDPRGERGHLPRSTVAVPWKPGEWQRFEIFC